MRSKLTFKAQAISRADTSHVARMELVMGKGPKLKMGSAEIEMCKLAID